MIGQEIVAGLAVGITLVLGVLLLVTLSNLAALPRLRIPAGGGVIATCGAPRVSVLIPARNEAEKIALTLRSLLAQEAEEMEIILLDDDSSDDTGQAARQAAGGFARFRVIAGQPLPNGWLGKNWACHQLSQVARGDILIFTDADVTWEAGALRALLDEMQRTQADLLTVWPTQRCQSWAERLVVPLMGLAVVGYLPALAVHHLPWAVFSAAMGQCLAFRRLAYQAVGGHAAVRGLVVEDMAFARMVKRRRMRLRMADAAGLISCRMYHDWPSVRDGFAKNILPGHGGALPLALSTLFHWGVFVLPWAWLCFGWAIPTPGVGWALATVGLGLSVRALTARATRQRWLDALWMPVSVWLMTLIAGRALWWHWRGQARWKGRSLATLL